MFLKRRINKQVSEVKQKTKPQVYKSAKTIQDLRTEFNQDNISNGSQAKMKIESKNSIAQLEYSWKKLTNSMN